MTTRYSSSLLYPGERQGRRRERSAYLRRAREERDDSEYDRILARIRERRGERSSHDEYSSYGGRGGDVERPRARHGNNEGRDRTERPSQLDRDRTSKSRRSPPPPPSDRSTPARREGAAVAVGGVGALPPQRDAPAVNIAAADWYLESLNRRLAATTSNVERMRREWEEEGGPAWRARRNERFGLDRNHLLTDMGYEFGYNDLDTSEDERPRSRRHRSRSSSRY